jgi:hypothetical protein
VAQEVYVVEHPAETRAKNAQTQVLLLGLIGAFLYFGVPAVTDWLEGWSTFDAPYKYTAAVFYYLLFAPVSFMESVWNWEPTQWNNLNKVISILASACYGVVCVAIAYLVRIPLLLISVITLAYWAITSAFLWLFA